MQQAIGAIVLGAPLFLWGLAQFRKSRAASQWPAAPGWILQSSVESSFQRGDEESADSYTYTPKVVYQYQVGPHTFQGDRISIAARGYQHPHQAQAALAPYPQGQQLWVRYNPAKPQESCLQPAGTDGVLLMAIGGLILAVALIAALAA